MKAGLRFLACCLAVMLAALSFAGCTKQAATVTVELEENPSTGYTWSYTADPEGILKETESEYAAGEALPGAPGTRTFTFAAVQDGVVALTFRCAQDWDGGLAGETYVVSYRVENGAIDMLTNETIPAPALSATAGADGQLLRIDRVSVTDGKVVIEAVYMESHQDDDGSEPYAAEIDGAVHTLTVSPDAVIDFSPDFGPDTVPVTAAEFAERFSALAPESGILYMAVLDGETVTALTFTYEP